ncbi:S8 family serine peptidase [Scytonema sp. PCC 10023]|uniref:S8 family serine peptidase n=1 Tax=Scytonema sp. PCC 10023 TaxID=1680591 RepID=UPI0039C75477
MKKIDAGLDFIKHLTPKERLNVAAKVNYMAFMAASTEGATPETRIQVLIQVKNPSEALNIPGVFLRSAVGNILSAQITPEAIEHLEMHSNVQYVERGSPLGLQATVETSFNNVKIEVTSSPLTETGKGVIVGIIDWGCDFTHGDFRNESGSRVLYFWDQTATPGSIGRPPLGYSGGVEFTKEQLDQALSQTNPFAALSIEPPDIGAHGTHVMGIAAGNGGESPDVGVRGIAPEADIIFVQPNTGDTNIIGGFGDSVNLAEAVKYIFEKASSLNSPAVINMSMGTNSGPHDGTTLVEQWIDRLLGQPGRAVVMALGNEHRQGLIHTHSEGQLATGETTTLYWRARPQDFTPNEVEIWYSGRDIFVLEVVLPDGKSVPVVEPNNSAIFDVGHIGTRVYISNELNSPLNGDNRINVIVLSPENTPTEAGVWQLRLTSRLSREGTFDAWIERESPAFISSFIGGTYIRRKTLGSIQSARHPITVSNYDAETITLADSTSFGPTRDGRRAPVAAAPGVNILAARSRYREAPNPLDRTPYVAYTGTSMSSPYTAGVVACMLQKNPSLTASQIKGILAANAKPAPGYSYDYRNDWGHGRVDPIDTLAATPAASEVNQPNIEPAPCPLIESQPEGPFYRQGSPFTTNLYPEDSTGLLVVFSGTVSNTNCEKIANALIDVWQSDDKGAYDNDDPDNPPAPDFFRCRGRMKTDESGNFTFNTVIPSNYQPDPVGNPSWFRVKHIHFKVFADGYQPLTTEVGLEPDDFVNSDFWLKPSLLTKLVEINDGTHSKPYLKAHFDFVLNRLSKRGYVEEATQRGLFFRG